MARIFPGKFSIPRARVRPRSAPPRRRRPSFPRFPRFIFPLLAFHSLNRLQNRVCRKRVCVLPRDSRESALSSPFSRSAGGIFSRSFPPYISLFICTEESGNTARKPAEPYQCAQTRMSRFQALERMKPPFRGYEGREPGKWRTGAMEKNKSVAFEWRGGIMNGLCNRGLNIWTKHVSGLASRSLLAAAR